ncbi:MAG TPA: hydroxyacid dehydrogenase [Lacunisphaera sp.]
MKPKAIYIGEPVRIELAYGKAEHVQLAAHLQVAYPALTVASLPARGSELREIEVVLTTWGMPVMDETFLRLLPRLKVVFYAAGSVRGFVTDASWKKGVRVVSASAANAIPAAEFSFAQIILALKHAWPLAGRVRRERTFTRNFDLVPGGYGSTVGLLALGRIGRLVAERLRSLEVTVIAYDPMADPAMAQSLGVRLCGMDEVFASADVVSCHLPLLPETQHLVRRGHFLSLRRGATFLNTARGSVVAEDEMIAVLRDRPDLTAVLDVAESEPPAPGSALYDLPNVVLTPHIAGCIGRECARLGASVAADVARYVRGETIANEVTQALADTLA